MGRIEHYKGLSIFLQSLNSLPEYITDKIEVHIVGRGQLDDGWNKTAFKTVISNKLVSDKLPPWTKGSVQDIPGRPAQRALLTSRIMPRRGRFANGHSTKLLLDVEELARRVQGDDKLYGLIFVLVELQVVPW